MARPYQFLQVSVTVIRVLAWIVAALHAIMVRLLCLNMRRSDSAWVA